MEAPHFSEPLLPPTRPHSVATQKTTPATSTTLKRPIWLTWLHPPTEPAANVLCLAGDYRMPRTAQRDSHWADLGVPGCVASTDWGSLFEHQTAIRFQSPFLFEPGQFWVLVQYDPFFAPRLAEQSLCNTHSKLMTMCHAELWLLLMGMCIVRWASNIDRKMGLRVWAVLLTFVATFINWMWP